MNKKSANPSELARETLKTLATRKIPPTPDSYTKIYAEISGTKTEENNGAEKVLHGIAERLAQAPQTATLATSLEKAISTGKWAECLKEIEKVLPKQSDGETQSWSNLIRDMLRQLETTHKGLTITRKKEGLETVLKRFGGNPEALFEKLTGLMRSWSESAVVPIDTQLADIPAQGAAPHAPAAVHAAGTPTAQTPVSNTELSGKLAELLAQTLEVMLSSQPQLTQEMQAIVRQVRSCKTEEQLAALTRQLHSFLIKAELNAIDNTKIHEGLLRLLRLLVENIGEMIEDEDWLHGQIAILQEIIAKPVDRHAIADAERGLRVLCMGNIGFSQNLPRLVQAFEESERLPADTRLIITGTGELEPEVRAQVRSDRVEMKGLLPSIDGELDRAAVGLVPQRPDITEFNLPSKLMNFMARGVPVLASVRPDSETAKLVHRSGGGWLADASDPDAFPETVLRIHGDPEDRAARGRKARSFAAENFSADVVADQFERILEDTVGKLDRVAGDRRDV